MVTIIGAGRTGFDAKRWMEDWGLYGTNEDRAGATSAVPLQSPRRRRQKRQSGGGKRERRIVLIQRKAGKLGNLGRTTGWIHRAELVKSGRVNNLTNRVGCTLQ